MSECELKDFKNILVTGATGLLGSHITRFLAKKGMSISILKRASSDLKYLNEIENSVTFYDSIAELKGKTFDGIFHLRNTYGTLGEKALSKNEILKINHDEPLELLTLLELDEKTILFNFNTSLNENINDYAFSKHQFVKSLGVKFPNLKLVNILLEQYYAPNDERFIGFLFKSFMSNKKAIELTEGNHKRDFIYYKDILNALECIFENLDFNSLNAIDLPLGSGEFFSIRSVVKTIQKITKNSETRLAWGAVETRENEPDRLVADLKDLKSLGFKPKYSLEEGLREVYEMSFLGEKL